jgi:hypothetical protein
VWNLCTWTFLWPCSIACLATCTCGLFFVNYDHGVPRFPCLNRKATTWTFEVIRRNNHAMNAFMPINIEHVRPFMLLCAPWAPFGPMKWLNNKHLIIHIQVHTILSLHCHILRKPLQSPSQVAPTLASINMLRDCKYRNIKSFIDQNHLSSFGTSCLILLWTATL